jgi:hypothetical protein
MSKLVLARRCLNLFVAHSRKTPLCLIAVGGEVVFDQQAQQDLVRAALVTGLPIVDEVLGLGDAVHHQTSTLSDRTMEQAFRAR